MRGTARALRVDNVRVSFRACGKYSSTLVSPPPCTHTSYLRVATRRPRAGTVQIRQTLNSIQCHVEAEFASSSQLSSSRISAQHDRTAKVAPSIRIRRSTPESDAL
jgi:hypothetical protein